MAAGLGLTAGVRHQRDEGEMADVPRSLLSAQSGECGGMTSTRR